MLYFLKHKSDFLLATAKYLAYGHVKCLWTDNRTAFTSESFQWLLVFIESNMNSQLLILLIKMGPLNSHGELNFLWQGVSLLSQNCSKTWLQHILEIVIIKTQEKLHIKVLPVQNQT